jgi:hypothetical protein
MRILSRCRVKISLTFAVMAFGITWLVLSDNSPFERFFLYHVTGRNIVGELVFVPYLALLLLRPTFWADQISYALVFTQWLIVGFIISLPICRESTSK